MCIPSKRAGGFLKSCGKEVVEIIHGIEDISYELKMVVLLGWNLLLAGTSS